MLEALIRRHSDMSYFYLDLAPDEVALLSGNIITGIQFGRQYWACTSNVAALASKRVTS